MNWPKLMCLTADGLARSHLGQVRDLCAAGADWIQLRAKDVSDAELEPMVLECLVRCRQAGCRFVLNDRFDLALKIGADGVHLGTLDMPWTEARRRAGRDFLIGGTVHSAADAKNAMASGALDYVGVGPFKATRTKKNLASVLTEADWREILNVLGETPRYAVGGIETDDLKRIRALGLSGAAVCSALYRGAGVCENYPALCDAYENGTSCHRG